MLTGKTATARKTGKNWNRVYPTGMMSGRDSRKTKEHSAARNG